MKKILFTLVAAAAALTFTNCQKDEIVMPESVSGQPFEIVASPETRTVNDGMSTKWAVGDAVNVFHAAVSSKDYIPDGEFTLSDATTGTFTGAVGDALTEDSSYDWYMFYPYSSYITTPDNTDSGYCYIGSRSDRSQAQTGIDNMSHIAGSNYPMAGMVEDVMGGEKPHITMSHISALVRVNVTNNNTEDITVTSIQLSAAEDIVGTFYYNMVTGKYTAGSYVSATATLDVTDGVVAAGKTAAFYLAIKPYALENEDLIVTIAAEGYKDFEKTFTGLSTSFTAGKIKTINVAYEGEKEQIETSTWTLLANPNEMVEGQYIIVANYNNGQISYLPTTTTSSAPKYAAAPEVFDLSTRTIEYGANDDLVWNLAHIGENKWYITNSSGDYFYSTAANNGLRVGSTADAWIIDTHADNSAAFVFQSATTSRYVGIYNAADWRCYTTYNQSNYKGSSQIYLYYKGTVTEKTALEAPVVTATVQNLNEIVVSWNAIENAANYTVTCGDASVTTDATTYTFTELNYNTEYTITVTANPADIAKYKESTGTTTATTGVPAEVTYYTLVTSTTELTAGKYLLVYKAGNIAADGSKAASKSGIGASGVKVVATVTDDGIISESSTDAAAFTITPATNGYTIQNSANEYVNGPTGENGMQAGTEANNNYLCGISFNTDGSATIANFDATTQLVYNTSGFFRFYKNSTVTGSNAANYPHLHIYKLSE